MSLELIQATQIGKQRNDGKNYKDFHDQLEILTGQSKNGKVCIFLNEYLDPQTQNKLMRLVFAAFDANNNPDTTDVVGLDLPCPPYCGDVNKTNLVVSTYP